MTRRAIVTGASRGIGQAISRRLTAEGWEVVNLAPVEIVDAIPVGRLGEPDDIANATAFFFDERSAFVTGQVLYVCGGITLARGGS